MSEFDELDKLLDRYLEGLAAAEEVASLERLILSDDRAAERASEWSLVHRQIAELLTEQSLHKIMSEYVGGSQTLPRALVERVSGAAKTVAPRGPSMTAAGGRNSSAKWAWLAASAVAVAAAATVMMAIQGQSPPPATDTVQPAAPVAASSDAAATVTRIADAVWDAGARPLRCGELLNNGDRVALESGLIKVTFNCGAEVVLEGPCDFTIRDKMVCVLKRGKITAHVPRRAFSFAVLSPGVDFVDLGTSFGVSVDEHGQSDLSVFEGEVLCSPNGGAQLQRGEAVHVEATNSLAFNAVGEAAASRTGDTEFSPLRALRGAASSERGSFDGENLALWLKADLGVHTDDQRRVLSWQDVLYQDNRTGEDATQFEERARPVLAPQAIHGKSAVRFNGTSDFLVTTPLETTDNQTVAIVCQFSESALDKGRRWGGQILNYDGPPGREASNMMAPGVLQIGEPLLESDFRPTALSAQVFAGFVGTAVIESGRTDGEPVGPNRPVIIVYRYDFAHGKSTLAVNGRVASEVRAFAPQSITSRKIIGRHAWKDLFFHGDLAELLIFNEALGDDKLARVTDYLADKYAISLEAPAGDASAEN